MKKNLIYLSIVTLVTALWSCQPQVPGEELANSLVAMTKQLEMTTQASAAATDAEALKSVLTKSTGDWKTFGAQMTDLTKKYEAVISDPVKRDAIQLTAKRDGVEKAFKALAEVLIKAREKFAGSDIDAALEAYESAMKESLAGSTKLDY